MFQSRNNPTVHLCPCILRPTDHHAYYGGKQEWLTRNTAYYGGCAPICGANVIATCAVNNDIFQELLGIKIDEQRIISIEDYTRILHGLYDAIPMFEVPFMNRLYDNDNRSNIPRFMPPTFGTILPTFIIGMSKFAKNHGIKLKAHRMYTFNSNYMRGLTFIKLALSNGHPVVLLTTNNSFNYTLYTRPYQQGASIRVLKRHFVTITDIQSSGVKDNPDLMVSNNGKTGRISYKDLHASWKSPKSWGAGMVYFVPELME